MNSTTAGPASGLASALGVSVRSGNRASATAEPARAGDFQRLLARAAEKKTAARQQQAQQLENRQMESRRLEAQRSAQQQQTQQQQAKLEEQRQQQPTRAASGNDGTASRSPAAPPVAAGEEQTATTSSAGPDEPQPESTLTHTASPPPADGGNVSATTAELPRALTPLMPDHTADAESQLRHGSATDPNPEPQLLIALEDIAHLVTGDHGLPAADASGGAGREPTTTGVVLSGMLRPAAGTFYRGTPPSTVVTQSPAGAAEGSMATEGTAAFESQLAAAIRQNGGFSPSHRGGGGIDDLRLGAAQLEAGAEPGTAREGGVSSLSGSSIATAEGKATLLNPGVTANPATGVRAGVGQPEWHSAVAERVAVMAAKNLTSAEIQLDPPELGQLLVRVTLNQEQASVNFSSQHAVVREALDQTAQRLREMFEAEGLNLINVDISDRSFQQRQHQRTAATGSGEGGGDESLAAEAVVVHQGRGLIDQFV